MKTIFSVFLTIISFISFGQEETHYEVKCPSEKVVFYDNADFLHKTKNCIKIEKREGANSYKDLTDLEIKMLETEAKRNKSCVVICDFDYKTPELFTPEEKLEDKVNEEYFHFHIATRLKVE